MSNAVTATAVRTRMTASALGDRLAAGAQRRLDRLRGEPEAGAQAAEYAMLGGVGAATCGTLVILMKDKGTLETLVKGLFKGLAELVTKWF
ncbi:MAG TPA: hypothetical protein VM324_11615 [Egibacteraceae bacterium]|nr:hypothetical protein [Egibacteraceae bacterium]